MEKRKINYRKEFKKLLRKHGVKRYYYRMMDKGFMERLGVKKWIMAWQDWSDTKQGWLKWYKIHEEWQEILQSHGE